MSSRRLNSNAGLCWFGAFVFVLFGLFMFPWTIWNQAELKAMMGWPTTEGEIERASIQNRYTRPKGMQYFHDLTYRFSVGGHSYAGHRITYGAAPAQWWTEEDAKRALPGVGSKVRIRYNPDHPADSVVHIVPLSDSKAIGYSVFAAVVGAGGALLMIVARKRWKRDAARSVEPATVVPSA